MVLLFIVAFAFAFAIFTITIISALIGISAASRCTGEGRLHFSEHESQLSPA